MSDSADSTTPQTIIPWWEDYIDILIQPRALFARRGDAGFGRPLLILTVLMTAIFAATQSIMAPVFEAELQRSTAKLLAENPQMTPEQLNAGQGFLESFGVLFAAIGAPIMVFSIGLMIWLVAKVMEANRSLGQSVTIAAFAVFPRILEQVVNAVQAALLPSRLITSRWSLSLGPARVLDPDTTPGFAMALLGRLDLFTIWITVLIVAGLRSTTKLSAGQAALAGIVIWLVGGLLAILTQR